MGVAIDHVLDSRGKLSGPPEGIQISISGDDLQHEPIDPTSTFA
jgi:hypothetical protein